MRPPNQIARDRLRSVLGRSSAVRAADLAMQLGVSVPTLHRMLASLGSSLVATGQARRSRYALRRPLRGEAAPLPVYEVDEGGRAERIGALSLTEPAGSVLDLGASGWPVPDLARDGWWDGLPYPVYDMRPQGYLGRQLARAEHHALGVPDDPERWNDDDIAHVLNRIGSDCSGNWIIGDPAFERWQQGRLRSIDPLPERGLGQAYARLAEEAVARGVPGSSAAGEFPKFPALRAGDGGATPHVLVKFSGADESSPAVRRWADLLVCEHLALACVALLPGAEGARSRVLTHGGRTFLEVERFDRHGMYGRSRLASLAVLDAALLGEGSANWPHLAGRLADAGLLDSDDAASIEMLWWFGRLIANTDMHTGNLSFRPRDGRLSLAPAYDMLPMLYAPLPGGEVPARTFDPPLPRPDQRPAWLAACDAAIELWARAATDHRISETFRTLCVANGRHLQSIAMHA